MKTVVVAMSGGVDSSVAALLLKREGYDVIGVHLKLFDAPENEEICIRSCCSAESAQRARHVCGEIGAKFYVLNYRRKFEEFVIKPFAKAYLEGRTPNPCVACNHWIKFDALLNQMRATGVDAIATGHYMRKLRENDEWILHRGKDRTKDQSYFLYMLTQNILDHSLFPNGDYMKDEIRKIAADEGLKVADQPESQEICFTLTDSYASIIKSMYPGKVKEGPIVDKDGRVIGRHKGIVYYTVGQRRGLGIAASEPLFVLEIKPDDNMLVVGSRDETFSDGLIFNEESFVSGNPPGDDESVEVQIRYNAAPTRAVFEGKKGRGFGILFDKPQPAVTSGQAVVIYQGDILLGGGTILKSC